MKRMILACALLAAANATAGGFANNNLSASGIGLANAFVASADDVSAAAYNPAGIAWQDGINIMAGLDIRYRNSSVQLPGAGVFPNEGGSKNLNHLYLSWMPKGYSFGLAAGYTTPFDVDNIWRSAFPATAGQTRINIDRVNLDLVYAVSSTLAFAAGGDWYLSSVDISQGATFFQGSDNAGFGGHASLKWKFLPEWMVGAQFRFGATIKPASSTQQMTLKLPDELTIGIAHDFADQFRAELDANWTRWSKMKDLHVRTAAGAIVQSNLLDLKDTFSVMAGLTWYWRENTQLRIGYAYDRGANSKAAFHPALADQDGHTVSLGAGGDMFGVHADAAYTYTFYPKQSVQGAFAGNYRDRRHGPSLSISKRF